MIYYDLDHLLSLADTMAAAAITFNSSQGYELFLSARQDFKDEIEKLKQVDKILSSAADTH